MKLPITKKLLTAAAAMLLLSGCHNPPPPPPPPPAAAIVQQGSLTRSLDMVDTDGRHYGRVEMDPVGGGKVYDSTGRLIGNIVPPER